MLSFAGVLSCRKWSSFPMSKPVDIPDDVEALKALLVASKDRNLRKQDRIDQWEKRVAEPASWSL